MRLAGRPVPALLLVGVVAGCTGNAGYAGDPGPGDGSGPRPCKNVIASYENDPDAPYAGFDDCFYELSGSADLPNLGLELLHFDDSLGAPRLGIARSFADFGDDFKTLDWVTLRGFALIDDGQLTCITCTEQLEYYTGHHNWTEQAIANAGGVQYWVDMVFAFPEWNDRLTQVDPGSATIIWGPEQLTAARCRTDPPEQPDLCCSRPHD